MKRNKIIFYSFLVVGGIYYQQFFGGGFSGIQQMNSQGQNNKIQRNNQTKEIEEIKLASDKAKELDKVAKERIQSGCNLVVGNKEKDKVATLIKGNPVLHNTGNVPLPAGTCVWDAQGNTAIIQENDEGLPVASLFAFTGDRDLIAKEVKRYAGVKFNSVSVEEKSNGKK